MSKTVEEIASRSMKESVDEFRVGDTVDVHVRIVEGDKERIQVFTGTVIARKGGGTSASFTVRRIVEGEGVERVFPLHSPRVEKVAVRKTGKARRAKLHFLRKRTGKATKLAERREALRGAGSPPAEEAEGPASEEAPPEGAAEGAAGGEE